MLVYLEQAKCIQYEDPSIGEDPELNKELALYALCIEQPLKVCELGHTIERGLGNTISCFCATQGMQVFRQR